MVLTRLDGSMNEYGKPLAFRESNSELWLSGPDGVLLYADDSNIPEQLDVMNYKHFGRPFMREGIPKLEWGARTDAKSISDIAECHCFNSGLLISSRIRALIEAFDRTNLEFIPLKIRQSDSAKILANDWWYCNIYNWKDAYDFEKSEYQSEDIIALDEGYMGDLLLVKQFGSKIIKKISKLAVMPQALEGGLFLARAPMPKICRRVFVGHELGRAIVAKVNEHAPKQARIGLEVFDPTVELNLIPFPSMDKNKPTQSSDSPFKNLLSGLFRPN
jgi:hypothetical protein